VKKSAPHASALAHGEADHPRQQCVLGSVQTAKDRCPLFASAELDAALVGVAMLNVRSASPG
jgi:hypothetical protein